MRPRSTGLAQWVLFAVLALGVGGCASLSGALRDTPNLNEQVTTAPPSVNDRVETQDSASLSAEPRDSAPVLLAAASESDSFQVAQKAFSLAGPPDTEIEEYDPWEPFNEKMFDFNRGLDRWVIKPVAKGYNKVMPDPWQQAVGNAFSNIGFVPRMVNSLLQGRFAGAGRELLRLVVNSSIGLGGLMDIAKQEGFEKSNADLGQTLGVWGVGPGPYLILPFLPPLTVRDAIGYGVDGAMNPLSYFIPVGATFGMRGEDTVNDRSLNLDLYQGFEESTVDFYSGLRNAYLQRRQKLIKE